MTAIAIIGAMDEEVANIATALSNVTVTEEAGTALDHTRTFFQPPALRCAGRRCARLPRDAGARALVHPHRRHTHSHRVAR